MKNTITQLGILALIVISGVGLITKSFLSSNNKISLVAPQVKDEHKDTTKDVAVANEAEEGSLEEIIYNTDGSIDTSNWKTYRNEEYGFEVRYPESDIFIHSPMSNRKKEREFTLNINLKSYSIYRKTGGGTIHLDIVPKGSHTYEDIIKDFSTNRPCMIEEGPLEVFCNPPRETVISDVRTISLSIKGREEPHIYKFFHNGYEYTISLVSLNNAWYDGIDDWLILF